MRPRGRKFDLSEEEMNGLSYYVLSGCSREDMFLRFVRPDFLGTKAPAAFKAAVKQFFAVKDVQEYIESYRRTIDELLSPRGRSKPQPETAESLEAKKARARTKAMEFAMALAENLDEAQDPESVMKILDKVGILDVDEQAEELPRRYLPVCCNDCAYRKFVEENCEEVPDGTDIAGDDE